MLKKLFQPDKIWYDETNRRLKDATFELRYSHLHPWQRIAIKAINEKRLLTVVSMGLGKTISLYICKPGERPKIAFDEPSYQLNTMMGDLPFKNKDHD